MRPVCNLALSFVQSSSLKKAVAAAAAAELGAGQRWSKSILIPLNSRGFSSSERANCALPDGAVDAGRFLAPGASSSASPAAAAARLPASRRCRCSSRGRTVTIQFRVPPNDILRREMVKSSVPRLLRFRPFRYVLCCQLVSLHGGLPDTLSCLFVCIYVCVTVWLTPCSSPDDNQSTAWRGYCRSGTVGGDSTA